MKRLKRLSSVLIACVMMLAMCIPVFAANTVTAGSGSNTLYIHKIDQTALEEYLTAARGAGSYTASETANTGAELASSAVIGTWTSGTTTSDVTVAEIAAFETAGTYGKIYLENIPFTITQVKPNSGSEGSNSVSDYTEVSGGIKTNGVTASDGGLIFTGLPDGYYRVTETANSIATSSVDFIIALPYDPTGDGTTYSTIHAYPKNSTSNAIEKEIEEVNGNVISWKITTEIPYDITASKGSQSYVIKDTVDSRLTLDQSSIDVYYNGASGKVSLASGDYTVSYSSNVLTITLEDSGYAKLAAVIADTTITDKNLYVEYDTVVTLSANELAGLTSNPITNKAELNFVNNSGSTYKGETTVTEDDFGGIKIIKVDGADSSVSLAGAKFEVYLDSAAATTPLLDSAGNKVELTTGADGTISLAGLGAGTYYLKETAAPSGYKALTGIKSVTITDTQAENQTVVEITIKNYFDHNDDGGNFTLPATGGTGTMLFTIIGIALIAVAGVVFYVSKRKKNASN